MGRTGIVGLAALAGCAAHGWELRAGGVAQSISGPQPAVLLRPLGGPSSVRLMIECAPDGLQLGVGGRFTDAGATLRFDDGAPITLPTRTSRRGFPVVDLRAPVAGGATAEALLVGSTHLESHAVPPEAPVVAFEVGAAERAIRRLRCPD